MNNVVSNAKCSATRLRARLSDLGVALSHTQALEAVASVLSGMDWNRYCAFANNQEPPRPTTPFVFSRPGEGGWSVLRFHDLVALNQNPNSTAIWCFADQLNSETFLNPHGIHVLRTAHEIEQLSLTQKKALAVECRGKILLVHAPPNFGLPEESLSAAKSIFKSLRDTAVFKQAASVSWLDMHRWTHAPGSQEFLKTLAASTAPMRFQSQIASDLDLVSDLWSTRVMCASAETEKQILEHLRSSVSRQSHPLELSMLNTVADFDPSRLQTLEGCVAYCRHRMQIKRMQMKIKPGTANTALKIIEDYLATEKELYEKRLDR